VDWFFLEGVLMKLGFDDRWIKWIMACVTSVSYCIKINGQLTENIFPSRGQRQGDPLSPYLFLFVTDGLSKLVHRAIHREELKDFKSAAGHQVYLICCLLMIAMCSLKPVHLKQRS
jgi:hypothetical protein